MKNFLVVTITCPDRPGIVESVTDAIVAHGGNWEESRLARLGGDFAGMILISADSQHVNEMRRALTSLSNNELTVTVKSASPHAAMHEGHVLCSLRLEGADHEGIVHEVAAFLAKQGINVEAMETEIVHAPMSATPLFRMESQLNVPPSMTLDKLREQLQFIGNKLGVGIEIGPVRPRS